ncbi:Asp-tRNA(Asn)/Glu-tRNA(Gln) amidotransferase GatCAB subunit A [Candidatus Entotheonella serta]|nr:Asp-tRNA(Asn)/Glu-tRNA(Gln) amidotransferase GatCAB subunit A [Candidatus Entotheonella serta]
MASAELCFLSITDLAARLRTRDLSPVEVVEALLERIEAHNDTLLAYLHVDRENALAAARAVELELGSGGYRGSLHGVPVAYKDIYDVQGLPTTAASRAMDGYIASEDSTAAARLRQAGAICMGKLNTLEFASGSMEVFGTARNPWHTEMTPGGSSSGSGAALAACLVHGATGSDTGGSIRGPASFCGIVGIKPTYGRVSRAGVIPLSWSLDHAGSMARTVADTALLLSAMAGADPRDPTAALQPVPDYASGLNGDIQGLRIGVPQSFYFEAIDPEVESLVRQAIAVVESLGAEVREINLPHSAFGSSASWTIAYTESFAFHRDNFFKRSRDYTPAFLHKITGAACLTAEERLTAQRLRQVITREFLDALQSVDVIVSPTSAFPAHRIGATSAQSDTRSLTRPVSLTGLPALALPCGFTAAGLPVSMQVVGRAWAEATLFRFGHAYEQTAGWGQRRAPLTATGTPPEPGPQLAEPAAVDAGWVMDYARLTGLTFVTEADAASIAASIGPQKTQLAEARKLLRPDFEPPVRPVMT